MQIKYKLYEKRTEKGLTIRELERISNVSRSEINRIENGKGNPTLRTMCKLAEALKTEVTELFELK